MAFRMTRDGHFLCDKLENISEDLNQDGIKELLLENELSSMS